MYLFIFNIKNQRDANQTYHTWAATVLDILVLQNTNIIPMPTNKHDENKNNVNLSTNILKDDIDE